MIRKVLGTACLFSLLSTFALAIDSKPSTPNISKWARSQGSTVGVVIDYHGNVLPTVNGTQSVGSSSETWNVNASNLYVSSGLIGVSESWYSIPPSSNTFHSRAGGLVISTITLGAGASVYSSVDIMQSTVSRNVVLAAQFDVGTATSIFTCRAVVSGWDAKGIRNTEAITFSTSVGADQGTGNIAWGFIDTISISISSASYFLAGNLNLNIGTTNQIGLLAAVDTSSDVFKIQEGTSVNNPNTVNFSGVTATVNVQYDTITFGRTPGVLREDKKVWYRTKRSNQ